jgi:ELWxxDGT repeat protein
MLSPLACTALLLSLPQVIDVNPDVPSWFGWNPNNPGVFFRDQGTLLNDFVFFGTTGLASIEPGSSESPKREALWLSDGSAAGTRLVAQLGATNPPSGYPSYRSAALPNGDLLLELSSIAVGRELHLLDAQTEQVRLLADFTPGLGSSDLLDLKAFGGRVYVCVSTAAGVRFLSTDGTPQGTLDLSLPVAAQPISPGQVFVPAGGRLYLCGSKLLVLNGPAGNWTQVPLAPGLSLTNSLAGLDNGLLLFGGSDTLGWEPWVTDGTAAGTQRLADIAPGATGSSPGYRATDGQRVYFRANNPSSATELWVSDGTPAGTLMLADVGPGMASGFDSWKLKSDVEVVPGGVYFTAYDLDDQNGFLWFSDGTPAGTFKVPNQVLPQMPSGVLVQSWDLHRSGSDLYAFISRAPALSQDPNPVIARYPLAGGAPLLVPGTARVERWLKSPGAQPYFVRSYPSSNTLATIVADQVLDTWQPAEVLLSAPSYPSQPQRIGSRGLFSAKSGQAGSELRQIELQSGALGPIYEAHFGSLDAAPSRPFGETANGVVYAATDSFFGRELRLAKEPNQAWPFVELTPGAASSGFSEYAAEIGGRTLFSVLSPANQRGLWVSDGSAAGTLRLTATAGTPPSFATGSHARFKGREWFALDGQLVSSDGQQVTNLVLPAGSVVPANSLVATAGSRLLFEVEEDGANGSRALWSSDGTAAGSSLLWDPAPGNSAAQFSLSGSLGELLLLRVTTPADGQVVARSDGTPAGSFVLFDPLPGPQGEVLDLVTAGDRAFALCRGSNQGPISLWVSDGSLAGSQAVSSGPSEVGGLCAQRLYPLGWRRVAFAGLSSNAGVEPWASDGTQAGTQPLADLVPGPGGSYPNWFARIGPWIFCDVLDPSLGRELFRLPFALLGSGAADPVGTDSGARLDALSGSPALGQTLTLRASELEPGSAVALLIAAPAPLQVIDQDVLSYLLSPAPLTGAQANPGGQADFALLLPNQPNLVGREFFLQALAVDLSGPLYGLFALSNGLDVIVGP